MLAAAGFVALQLKGAVRSVSWRKTMAGGAKATLGCDSLHACLPACLPACLHDCTHAITEVCMPVCVIHQRGRG
jgi:hypothetical protein